MKPFIAHPAHSSYTIWESDPDIDETTRECLAAEYGDLPEEEQERLFYEDNANRLDDEKANLAHVPVPNGILAIASLGLWDGRKQGVLPDDIQTLPNCFRSYVNSQSEQTFYVDAKGEFRCDEAHHDGTNYYRFRLWKDSVTEAQKDMVRSRILSNPPDNILESLLRKYTYRAGDLIGDVYGWSFPNRPKASKPDSKL